MNTFNPANTTEHHVYGGILKMVDGSEVVLVTTYLHCSQGEDAHYSEMVAACEAIGAPNAVIMTTRDDTIARVSADGWVYRYSKLTGNVPQGLTGGYSIGDRVGAYHHIMPQTD